MVQSMFNQDKQFAWSADAFIIIFNVYGNKYIQITNYELMFALNVFMLVMLCTLAWQTFIFLYNNTLYGKIVSVSILLVCLHEHVLKCTCKLLPLKYQTCDF